MTVVSHLSLGTHYKKIDSSRYTIHVMRSPAVYRGFLIISLNDMDVTDICGLRAIEVIIEIKH